MFHRKKRFGSHALIDLPDETDSFELQLRNFTDAISGRARAVNDATLALQLMELIDAIDASSSLGREVPIV